MISYVYDTGTISVNAAGTAVAGVGTAWQTVGITRGDKLIAAGLMGIVASVTDNTHLTLSKVWPGTSNLAAASYEIVEDSPERDDLTTTQRQIGQIVNILNGTGYIYPVPAGGTPDPSLGENGQYALSIADLLIWLKAGGVWMGPTSIGAVVNADYLVKTANPTLSAERVVTDNSAAGGAVWDWSVAGQVKAKLYASGANKVLRSTGANAWAETSWTTDGTDISGVGNISRTGFNISPADTGYEWWNGSFTVVGLWQVIHRRISDGAWSQALSINPTTLNLDVGGNVQYSNNYNWLTWAAGGGGAADVGIDFGFGSRITRRGLDGHVKYESQNNLHEFVGTLTVAGTANVETVNFFTSPNGYGQHLEIGPSSQWVELAGLSNGDFSLSHFGLVANVMYSVRSGCVANTLVLKAGNSGFGTVNPATRVDVVAASNGAYDGFVVRPNNLSQGLYIGWGGISGSYAVVYNATGDGTVAHKFQVGGVDKVTILANGNVGIQQAAAVCALDVAGPVRVKSYTVGTLPAASLGAGMLAWVTDGNTTTRGATVTGGGSTKLLVGSDATNWLAL